MRGALAAREQLRFALGRATCLHVSFVLVLESDFASHLSHDVVIDDAHCPIGEH